MTPDHFKQMGIPMRNGLLLAEAAQDMCTPQPQSAPVAAAAVNPTKALDKTKPTVMLSYQWDTQPSAFIVRDAHERFNVIIDHGGIHGNFLGWMEWAVSSSQAVIILVSHKYNESDNCKREACRAADLDKKIVPVRLEPGFKPKDWLAMTIAGLIYYDGSNTTKPEESLRTIVDRELPKGV